METCCLVASTASTGKSSLVENNTAAPKIVITEVSRQSQTLLVPEVFRDGVVLNYRDFSWSLSLLDLISPMSVTTVTGIDWLVCKMPG